MRRNLFLLTCFVAAVVLSSPCFAQQVVNVNTSLSSGVGVPQGADMTGAVTLTVPDGFDVYTNNSTGGNVINPALVAIHNNSAGAGLIVFSGNSNVFGAVGQTGTVFNNISAGTAGRTVNFAGNVYSTTFTVSGTGTVNFNSGSTNITAMNFAGDGTLGLAANTIVNGALTTATDNTGTLMLGGGSVLNGAVGGPAAAAGLKSIQVVGGSNTAGVTGTITGAVNAYTYSLGTNTLNITGALTIADNSGVGGIINTTLASASVFGNIRPVGASNLGSALTVNVLVPATTYIPVGTLFNIVQTQTGTAQSGTNGSTVAVTVQNPTNPLYTFAAVPLAGTVAGLVTIRAVTVPLQVSLVLPPTVLPPAQPLAAPVASVLLNLPVTADVTSVLAALNAISDPALVVTSEAQLAPSTPNLATPFVAFQASRQFENLWTNRLDDTMCGQVGLVNEQSRSCRKSDPHTGWWLKGFGSVGSQDAQKSFTGYDTQLYGTMMAYDAPLSMRSSSGKTRIGGGFGYARSSIMGHTFAANSNFDTYKAMAYIGHEDGPWFVHGNASFGWNDYSSKRHIMFPGIDRTARANYSGQEYTGFVTTGYHFTVNGTTLTPLASLKFTHLDLGGYKENGAGDISLNVNSQSYDFLESGLGAKVAHPFATSGNAYLPKGTLVPEIHTKWLYEIINPSVKNTSTYVVPGSGSLTTPGMTSDANMFNVGTGLTFLSCECSAKTWSLEGVYDYDWTPHGYSSHQAMMRLTSSF